MAYLSLFCAVFGGEGKGAKLELEWRDMGDVGLEGKAWTDTPRPYSRVPNSFSGRVTADVWNNAMSSTGMCINFETDSPEIWVSRELYSDQLGEYNFNVCAFSGFDLYGLDPADGKLKWLAATPHANSENSLYRLFFTNGKKGVYRIYLPLRNSLKSAKVGVKKGSYFRVIPARKKPVVFYGTSIVHGAFASHAGLSHPSVIGRRLNVPIVNLGFSGSAKMEPDMADMLAEIDASVYVIDAQANMNDKLVSERCEKFLRRLRQLRPDTPILLVERAESLRGWYYGAAGTPLKVWLLQRAVYEKLLSEGEKNMAYLKGDKLFGDTCEASIDDVHPGDLGIMSMADKMTPIIGKLLGKQ